MLYNGPFLCGFNVTIKGQQETGKIGVLVLVYLFSLGRCEIPFSFLGAEAQNHFGLQLPNLQSCQSVQCYAYIPVTGVCRATWAATSCLSRGFHLYVSVAIKQ